MSQVFHLSVSTRGGRTKPKEIDFKRMKFCKQRITLSQFEELVRDGRTFAYCFNDGGKVFRTTDKTKENFRYTEVICYDMDYFDTPMDSYIKQLPYKPTLAYTTYSNGMEGEGFRFRLMYVFNEPIIGVDDYVRTYAAIATANKLTITDNCMEGVAQCFIGNGSSGVEVYRSDLVYSLSDFPIEDNDLLGVSLYNQKAVSKGKTGERKRGNGRKPKKDVPQLDAAFAKALAELSEEDFMDAYRDVYPYFDHSELILSEDSHYFTYPEDYYAIIRRWEKTRVRWGSNGRPKKCSRIVRWKDGEHRRRKLYMTARVMKTIRPDISLEHLVYNLVFERYFYYDNKDGVLTNEELIKAARNAFRYDGKVNTTKHPKFSLNKPYWAERGMNANQAKNIVRKEINYACIGELYDCNLSVTVNLQMLQEGGMKVSKNTLYRFCHENNISTKGARC